MQESANLAVWLAAWSAAAGAIMWSRGKRGAEGAGLVLAYLLHLWLLHWLGAAIYLLPWYRSYDSAAVELGFRESGYGIAAFTVGSVILAPSVARLIRRSRSGYPAPPPQAPPAKAYVVVGLACYLVLAPLAARVPTVSALVAAGWHLLAVGLGLGCCQAWREGKALAVAGWLAGALSLPFLTIVASGFLGYGISALLVVFALVTSVVRPRRRLLALGLLLGYLGLSFYVSYLRDRTAIREVVWGGESVGRRIEQLSVTLGALEWFDLYEIDHLERIDARLNQNALVGAAVQHIGSGFQGFARGETLWQALIGLVPRALWPDKPVVAGSMGLVTVYTGIQYAEGTSVGMGHVFELYINFGTIGVVVGFLGLGVILTLVDSVARQRLVNRDWAGFTRWYLPGVAVLQVGGSLVEVTSSAGAAVVTAFLVSRYWSRGRRRGWPEERARPWLASGIR